MSEKELNQTLFFLNEARKLLDNYNFRNRHALFHLDCAIKEVKNLNDKKNNLLDKKRNVF